MKTKIITLLLLVVACASTAWGDRMFGHQVIYGEIRFTLAETGVPIAKADVVYTVSKQFTRNLTAIESAQDRESEVQIVRSTDADGLVVVPIVFRFDAEFGADGRTADYREFLSPEGNLKIRVGDSFVACEFPHQKQDARVKVEWIKRVEQEEETKPPNQALQTTSVTRSGFERVSVSDRQRRGV
jgi:hypothetical protein